MTRRLTDEEARPVMLAAGLEPLEPYPGYNRPWPSKHSCGNLVAPHYSGVRNGQGGCKYCAGSIVNIEDAVSIMNAAGLTPMEPYSSGHTPWLCSCNACGSIVSPMFSNVRRGQRGCKKCAGQYVDPDEAHAAMEHAGVTPLVPYPGADVRWQCQCSTCGEIIYPRYTTVVKRQQRACKYCAGRVVRESDAIKLLAESGLVPLVQYPGADTPWLCKCLVCKNNISPTYSNVKAGRSKCAYCSKKRVDRVNAVSVMTNAGLLVLEPYPGSKLPWRSKCSRCMREVAPTYCSVKTGHDGCKYCSGHELDDFQAVSLMISAGLEPVAPYPGAHNKWLCRCVSCSREVTPTYGNVRRGQGGCKHCAFGPLVPSLIYLVQSNELGAIKIGICAQGKLRLQRHKSNGWILRKQWDTIGHTAVAAEARVLRNWRKAGIPIACTKEQMPQGGWTETAPLDMVDIAKVRRWVNYEIRRSRERENA